MLPRLSAHSRSKKETRKLTKKALIYLIELIPAAGFCRTERKSTSNVTLNHIFCMKFSQKLFLNMNKDIIEKYYVADFEAFLGHRGLGNNHEKQQLSLKRVKMEKSTPFKHLCLNQINKSSKFIFSSTWTRWDSERRSTRSKFGRRCRSPLTCRKRRRCRFHLWWLALREIAIAIYTSLS